MPARDRPTRHHRTDGTDRTDAPIPWPVKGTPGGWIDWFDDAQVETLRIRAELEAAERHMAWQTAAIREEEGARRRRPRAS